MKKTMIYLEEEQVRDAVEFAEIQGVSFAEVCRQALASYLENKKNNKSKYKDPLLKIVVTVHPPAKPQ